MNKLNEQSALWFILAVALILFHINGCRSTKDAQQTAEDGQSDMQLIEITGRLFVSGNEPFTELSIERDDGSVVVISRESRLYRELHGYQGRVLRLKGWFIPDPVFTETYLMAEYEVLNGDG
jgi:hypothetical protein